MKLNNLRVSKSSALPGGAAVFRTYVRAASEGRRQRQEGAGVPEGHFRRA
jgi:hypothetical protein